MNTTKEKESQKSRSAAFLLAFFLGSLGAHRFYTGKGGTGVVQLLLTITIIGALISGPWALIDCILILAGVFKDGNGLKIKTW